jgi:hypothetical protein
VGQAIGLRRLFSGAIGPAKFHEKPMPKWGMLQLANRPQGRGFSTLSIYAILAKH